MAQTAVPAPLTDNQSRPHEADRVLWRWAGGFGLAHIVVLLGAFSLEGVDSAEHGTSPSRLTEIFGDLGVERVFLASYAEAMAFVVLVPALVLMARLFGRRSEAGRAGAQAFLVLGTAYVASTMAIGFPPLTTAVYAAHHGIDAGTIATINDLRNYGFVLQVALSMAFALALGTAAIADRSLTKWAGWGGVAVGAIGLAATPFAHNAASMAWTVWWVGLSILCLRGGPKRQPGTVGTTSANR